MVATTEPLRRLGVLAAAITCVGVALLCALHGPRLWHHDAVQYLSLAEHLARGDGYASAMNVFPDLMQPPLYPLLVAGAMRLVGSAYAAAVIVCVLAQLGTFTALLFLHGELWGRAGRLHAAVVGAVSPLLALGAGLTLEAPFVCALAWTVALGVGAARRQSVRHVAGCGAALGLALLFRPEAVITAPLAVALVLGWQTAWRRRATGAFALVGALALVLLPYGLWMRAQLGAVEVLPKVRYNVHLADITEHMAWAPDQGADLTRGSRVMHALLPDHATFVLNHAFAHRDFDPRPLYPRRAEAEGVDHAATVRAVLRGGLSAGLFQPLALALALLGLWRGLVRAESRRLTLFLGALAGAHLAPGLLSGEDFEDRYLVASVLFSLPLVSGGAEELVRRIALRAPRLPARAVAVAVAVAVAGSYGLVTWRETRALAGRPGNQARWRDVDAASADVIPRGARVMAEHARTAVLRGGAAFQLPYVESRAELEAYVAAHGVEFAVLDARTLRMNPSRVARELTDPRTWPASWRPVRVLYAEEPAPIWIVAVR